MRRLKVTVFVLFTVFLLVTGAYIPKLAAFISDRYHTGAASLNPVASFAFNIRQGLPPVGKLAMMGKMDSIIPIKESKARLTREDVTDAVTEGLTPYMDAQLVIYHADHVEMRPYLTQVPDMPELQRVVWFVTVAGDESDFTFFDLVIDDETGQILRISYTIENPRDIRFGTDALNTFADIFFSGLEIGNYRDFATPDLEYAYVGDNANAVQFRFGDAQYGEITVNLYVHENGFYMDFPNN